MAAQKEDKIAFVEKWLEDNSWQDWFDLQGDGEILNELYELAQSSRLNEKKMAIIISEMETQLKEYTEKADQTSTLLKSMGLTYKDLPPNIQSQLDLLTETAFHLSLEEATPTQISLGMSALLKREAKLKHEINQLKQNLKHTNVELQKSLVDKDHFTKISDELLGGIDDESSNKERDKTKRFLDEKSQQYKKLIQKLQTELIDSGYNEDHEHGELIKFHKELQELEKQVKELTEQLKHFADLPPDLALAKVKVEEAKQEMELLENELSLKIDLVSAEI